MKKSAPNDALDPRRPTRYAPAVDRRVVRFNNDLQEPVLRKVTLRKKERRTSRVAYSGEAVLASTYFGPYLDGTDESSALFSLFSRGVDGECALRQVAFICSYIRIYLSYRVQRRWRNFKNIIIDMYRFTSKTATRSCHLHAH